MELIASSCDQNVSYVGFHSGRNRNIRFATRDDTIRVLDLRSNRRKKRGKSIFAVNFSFFFFFFFLLIVQIISCSSKYSWSANISAFNA